MDNLKAEKLRKEWGSMIPIIIIYIAAQKQFKAGLMAGGIKG